MPFLGSILTDGDAVCNTNWSISMDEPGSVTTVDPPCLEVRMPDLSASFKAIDPASLPAGAKSTVHYRIQVATGARAAQPT